MNQGTGWPKKAYGLWPRLSSAARLGQRDGTFIAQQTSGRANRRFLYLIRAGGATRVLKGYAAAHL